jgi:putative PIN family toxin of toxin-antitoxin system
MAALCVVLDTNVLVSGLAYPSSVPGRIVSAWRQGGLHVVLSRYILDELARVLPRLPRIQMRAEDIRDLVDSLMFMADVIEPGVHNESNVRDPEDGPVLATLVSSQADYLITGDKDLLLLDDRYPILSPASFWSRHGG